MVPDQMALELVKREHVLDYGINYCTTGEFAGQIVLYLEEHDDTGHALCNIEVPKGHHPIEVIIPHNYLQPLTREQHRSIMNDNQMDA